MATETTTKALNQAKAQLNFNGTIIADMRNHIATLEAAIAGKPANEMVRPLIGDARPMPVTHWQADIQRNLGWIAGIESDNAALEATIAALEAEAAPAPAAKPMPKTLKAFNRRLAKDGVPVEVVQGQGYVYFIYEDGNPAHYTSHSVSVCYWDQMAPDRWLAEVVEFRAKHEAELAERAERPAGTLKLKLGR